MIYIRTYVHLVLLINILTAAFTELQSHYSVLVRSMPDDYMNSVSQLERHLTGDHIGTILECKDVLTANQRILDCLIEQINTKEGLLDFCERLNSINNVPALTAAVQSVSKGTYMIMTSYVRMYSVYVCKYICTYTQWSCAII